MIAHQPSRAPLSLDVREMKNNVAQLTNENDRRVAAIDLLWEIANGLVAIAWIELVVASRTVNIANFGLDLGSSSERGKWRLDS